MNLGPSIIHWLGTGLAAITTIVTAITTTVIATASAATPASLIVISAIAEAVLLVLLATFLPVAVVRSSVVSSEIATTAPVRSPAKLARAARGNLAITNCLRLLCHVVEFPHDQQRVAFPLWRRIQSHEFVRGFLVRPFHKDRALENFLRRICSSEANRIELPILCEKRLDIELGGRSLIAKTLNIDTMFLSLIALLGVDRVLSADSLLALRAINDKEIAGLEGFDNSFVWLEASHAREATYQFKWNWVICFAANLLPEKFIIR